MISSIAGGRAYTARNAARLIRIYKSLGSSISHKTMHREISSWFAAGAAALLLRAFGASRFAEGLVP